MVLLDNIQALEAEKYVKKIFLSCLKIKNQTPNFLCYLVNRFCRDCFSIFSHSGNETLTFSDDHMMWLQPKVMQLVLTTWPFLAQSFEILAKNFL